MRVLTYTALPLLFITLLVRDAAAQAPKPATPTAPQAQKPATPTAPQAQKPATATTAFREARDLIGEGEWVRAEAALNRFIANFPQDRDVPAARYWLAFSLKQQNKFAEADTVLIRLIQQHPTATSWLTDARAMRVEIAPRLGNTQLIEQGVTDSDDEIRLAALQTLFETRPERAVAMAAEILKAGSASSRLLKEGAISLLEDSETSDAIPLLSQVARSDTDMRVRRKAAEALGDIEDSSVIEPLKSIALQSTDVAVARAAVEGLGEQGSLARKALVEIAQSGASVDVRAEAIEALGDTEGDPAVVDDLVAFMATARDARLQQEVIEALGEVELPQAETALAEIARTSPNPEMRRQAVEALSEHETETAAASLAALYDTEKDERIKEEIIDALEETESRAAMLKLGQIAAKETSVRLRQRAITALAEFEGPEAAALLEQALKR